MAKKPPAKTPAKKQVAPSKPTLRVVERPDSFKGIEKLVWADAASLTPNPKNWKTHDQRQTDALDAEFSTVGWAGAMLYNLETGNLVDGHGRKQTRHVRQTGVVPVLVGRWTEQEEQQILLHLDPVGAMFQTDTKKFEELMDLFKERSKQLDQLSESDAAALEDVNKSLDMFVEAQDFGAPSSFLPSYMDEDNITKREKEGEKETFNIDDLPNNLPGNYSLKLWEEMPFDCYGTTGILDIPPLRPDRLASLPEVLGGGGGKMTPWVGPETPEAAYYFFIYGCAAIEKVRSSQMVVAFYTWDRKFESVWTDPRPFTARMLACKVHAAVTPNYSCWVGAPMAWIAFQIYRARWLGRYWQEAGINIIPDLQLPYFVRPDESKIMLAGIPKGAPCLSVQLMNRTDVKDEETFFATQRVNLMKSLEELRPQSLLAYCSPKLPKNFFKGIPGKIPVVQVETWMNARKKAVKESQQKKGESYLSEGVT
jgi:hypothetical protein